MRRLIADRTKSAFQLVPLREHTLLQASTTELVVFRYWQNSEQWNLSTENIQGCEKRYGFDSNGRIVLEREEDVRRITKCMKELVSKCRCKGQCTTRQCSCVKRELKCVGCECDVNTCQNKFSHIAAHSVEESAILAHNLEGEDVSMEEREKDMGPFEHGFLDLLSINPEHDYEAFRDVFDFE